MRHTCLSECGETTRTAMVIWGRNKAISTVLCLLLVCCYVYVEFGLKRHDVMGTGNTSSKEGVKDVHSGIINEPPQTESKPSEKPQLEPNWLQLQTERPQLQTERPHLQTERPQLQTGQRQLQTGQQQLQTGQQQLQTGQPSEQQVKTEDNQKKNETQAPNNSQSPGPDSSNSTRQASSETKTKTDATSSATRNDVVVRKFDPDKPKFILLLAQQRVGSSFIGGIFDRNNDAIYVYEPLEGVYTHLYGTKKGWAVPLDIHFHWNRTYRALPAFEMHAVATLIEQIFTCDYGNMLTEFLVHEFWYGFKQTQAHPYSACLKQIKVSVTKCQKRLIPVCEGRVGQDLKKEKHCKEQLGRVFAGQPAEEPFKQYKACMDTQRSQVLQKCVPIIDKICKSKPLSVIKTVRMDLETVVPLMDKYINMRVIHLIRDPRSVVLSRIKSGWSTQGATPLKASLDSLKAQHPKTSSDDAYHVNGSIDYDAFSLEDEMKFAPIPPNGVAREAQMYCSLTRKDIITRRHLEQKYPGSTYQMIYEHMVYHPLHELERIYEFINEPIPPSIVSWVKTLNSGTRTSQSIATKWQKEMSVESAKQIDKFCQNLYDTIDYSWPDPVRP